MTQFLRLLAEKDKAKSLTSACDRLRQGEPEPLHFEVPPESFDAVPGKPFAYWVSEAIRQVFRQLPAFEGAGRTTKQGLATADDFRFVRIWWESAGSGWFGFAKGGSFSPFYADVYLVVNWALDGGAIKNNLNEKGGIRSNVWMLRDTANNFFLRPGLTWPRRTNGLSFRLMPTGCIFADKGPAAFVAEDEPNELLAIACLLNSSAFGLLVSVQLARVELAQSFEVGLIQQTPIPSLSAERRDQLAMLGRRAWSLKRTLDTTVETSHAFLLPAVLRSRLGNYNVSAIEAELARIQSEIDALVFELYGFSNADRLASLGDDAAVDVEARADEGGDENEDEESDVPSTDALLSWALGVAFGRFDWCLATGQRQAPPEPDPFASLPTKSPGMLSDDVAPFHNHAGILVDDQSNPHDLSCLIEKVLDTVNTPVDEDIRRWLQKDFFAFHLKRYSKSRRKAPIYWPLATASGRYTLWLYYPSVNDQTLFTAVNNFVDPKLNEVRKDLEYLRGKGPNRSNQEEKDVEVLSGLQHELADLRDSLLEIAPIYRPNYDDGVQISAAPLWKLFRHKPWQKVLKDTWGKLEKGDYDWAHLAMNYWPDRIREKCITDKSLAIAHNLENLYIEPEPKPAKARGSAKKQDA